MSTPPPPPARAPAGSGLVLGRPFGVPVVVDWSWFASCVFLALIFAPSFAQRLPGLGRGASLLVGVSLAVLLGLSILAHELAHMLTALALGRRVIRVVVHFLGGQTEYEVGDTTAGQDFLIAAAGPAMSLLVAGVAFAATEFTSTDTVTGVVLAQLFATNLIVAIFNLLPGLPLDGGQLLRDVIWGISRRETLATLIAAWVGRAFAVLLVGWALFAQQRSGASTLSWLWLILIAGFMWVNAGRALASAKVREHLPTLQAGALTRRAIPVAPDLPVSEALRQLHEAGARALVVVDTDQRARGIVAEAAVAALPEQRRPWVTVATVARQIEPGCVLTADLAGMQLLSRLSDSVSSEYLVVDPSGAIVGVLSRADVEAALGQMGAGR
jgi:Zn-dependent protease/CBS domain-containing protein